LIFLFKINRDDIKNNFKKIKKYFFNIFIEKASYKTIITILTA